MAGWGHWFRSTGAVAALVVVAGLAGAPGPGASAEGPGRRVVVRHPAWMSPALADAALGAAGVEADQVIRRIPELDAAVVTVSDAEEAALEASPLLGDVERDAKASVQVTPDDPFFTSQPGLTDLGLPSAWDSWPGAGNFAPAGPYTGAPLAILDSGIDNTHQEFQPFAAKVPVCVNYPPNSLYDPVNCYTGASDTLSHGTHVAGIAAAATDDGLGVAGVAGPSPIYSYKVCQQTSCWTTDVASGLVDAADDGAKVANLSLGGPEALAIWKDAVRYAVSKDVVVLAASGNGGTPNYLYPASFTGALSVGAFYSGTTSRASFSQYNDEVDLAAPGTNVWSSVSPAANGGNPNGYRRYSGTSMATAYVSGIAALLRSLHPDWTAGHVRGALMKTALDAGAAGVDDETGWGRPDAAAAGAWAPAADGDVDDDGAPDDADAEPWDPQQWPLGAVALDATVGTAKVRMGSLNLFNGMFRLDYLTAWSANQGVFTFNKTTRAGTGLGGVTITGTALYVGPLTFRVVPFWLKVVQPREGAATVHLRAGDVTVVDGAVTGGTATVETP